jgi:uncharacterized tellurite resistance protein B-like protein
MYTDTVKTQEEAISHLFFHCCLEDDAFTTQEMDDISTKLVTLGLQTHLNLKEELIHYRSYKPSITDETTYIQFLIKLINPVNDLALYSYCAELCFSDAAMDPREDALLRKIGDALEIDAGIQDIIKNLVAQRKAVEIKKIF